MALLNCQPTNTTVGRSISKGGSSNTNGLQQVRLTDSNGNLLSGTQISVSVGSTLTLKAALFTFDGVLVGPASVRWSQRSVRSDLNSGLTCGANIVDQCDFTPLAPGSIYIDVTIPDRSSVVISPNDTSPLFEVVAPSVPTQFIIESGNNQTGLVDAQLSQPLKVKVTDAFNRGVPGVSVTFAVAAGGGSIQSANPSITDANGFATALVKLGTGVGAGNNTFSATVDSNTSLVQSLSASALPGAATSLVLQTPPLATYALLPFTQQPVVVAKDAFNNTVSTLNDSIVVSVQTGNGTVSGNTTKNLINGSVSFTDLAYSLSQNGVVLRFALGGLSVDSPPLNFTLPTGVGGITPADVNFGFKVVYSAGAAGRSTSDAVTVVGLSQPISISVTGPGNPRLRLNGGVETDSLYNVVNTDTLMVVADAPATPGVNVITINMGGRTETFEVRYVDVNKVAYAFVTNTTHNAMSIATDSSCMAKALAAGYQGTWKAMLATLTTPLIMAVPYQWGQLKRLDGQVIASSWNQLWTGPLSHSISIDEGGASKATNVWTGVDNITTTASANNKDCNNWTSSGSGYGVVGSSTATDSNWLKINLYACGSDTSVYCISDPTALQDTNPNDVSLTGRVTTVSGDRITSSQIKVSGVTTLIPVSVTATGGNARLKINGGSEVTSGTVGNGDQIVIVMSAPTVLSQKNTATFHYGDDTVTWWVGYADSSKVAAVFVSSTNTDGNMGGVGGANNICQAAATAQGYDGTWKALLQTTTMGIRENVPWSWGQLRRMDGAVVATNWDDLWDGTIAAPINLTEALVTKNSPVWMGGVGNSCGNFTDDGPTSYSQAGDSSSTTSNWLSSTWPYCATPLPIYCVSDPAGTNDTTPINANFPMKVSYVSGGTVDFNEVIVAGITSPMTVTLTGTDGSPVLKVNGTPAPGNSAAVSFGDHIVISFTAPTVLGTKYSATLMYGPYLHTLQVGYADSSKVARVFVSSENYSTKNGINAIDANCTLAAENAGLGGTWKAIASTDVLNAADRIPWNWGTLKLVDNTTLVASSWSDLWDGTLSHPIDMDENKTSNIIGNVATGSWSDGSRADTATSWASGGLYKAGLISSMTSTWMSIQYYSDITKQFYCIEDPAAVPDQIPTDLRLPYKVFQEVSTSVTSATYTVRGITTGTVSFTLTDLTGGSGSPTYSINGGASQSAGTPGVVHPNDTITLTMTSPAALNSSHKVTFTVGDSGEIPWRVWTKGVNSGNLIKRVFVSDDYWVGSLAGIAGADSKCQTEATAKSLGGTWKAILSGNAVDENQWAVNRIGYNWTELWTMNNSGAATLRVLSAPNIWNNETLENPLDVDENGAVLAAGSLAITNSDIYGLGVASGTDLCDNLTNGSVTANYTVGSINVSATGSVWINNGYSQLCSRSGRRLYCIEQ